MRCEKGNNVPRAIFPEFFEKLFNSPGALSRSVLTLLSVTKCVEPPQMYGGEAVGHHLAMALNNHSVFSRCKASHFCIITEPFLKNPHLNYTEAFSQ